MSLATQLLEGYGYYGNASNLPEDIDINGYLSCACVECVTALYEAQQQFFVGDIIGSTQVLMEGANAGQKLKELWSGFIKRVKEIIRKMVEKLSKIPAFFKNRSKQVNTKVETMQKEIKAAETNPKVATDKLAPLTLPKGAQDCYDDSIDDLSRPLNRWFVNNGWNIDASKEINLLLNQLSGDIGSKEVIVKKLDGMALQINEGYTVDRLNQDFETQFGFSISQISEKFDEYLDGMKSQEEEVIKVNDLISLLNLIKKNVDADVTTVKHIEKELASWKRLEGEIDQASKLMDKLQKAASDTGYGVSFGADPQRLASEIIKRITAIISVSQVCSQANLTTMNSQLRLDEYMLHVCERAWNLYRSENPGDN